jgi:hypothetical protein
VTGGERQTAQGSPREADPTSFDPYVHDPLHWGASMAHHAELMLACFDRIGARSVVEVGAYAGDLTRILVDWAAGAGAGAHITAIDPAPQPDLVALAERYPSLELVPLTSLEALPTIELGDAVVIDGDHNYYSVAHELELIARRASGAELPLLLFHDVCWPHGRRDDYFDPAQIPEEYRHPVVGEGAGITPGVSGVSPDGLPYHRSAAREGGARNGVLTAVEDFVAGTDSLRLVVVPAFFGFGAVWDVRAPWAERISSLLGVYDRNPLIERLETNRLEHIASEHVLRHQVWCLQERLARQEGVLRRQLESSAFRVAERLSRLRVRSGVAPAQSAISRQEVLKVLED